ncbi:hypothetical protein FGRMN_1808, partial [Fusarium graminum]
APPSPPNVSVLELNLTQEDLVFSAPLGKVPNRGLEQQNDIVINGVTYLQTVNDVTNTATGKADAPKTGIHTETGFWLNVPPTKNNPVVGNTLVRLGSIPHGTTINAQGNPPDVTHGAPKISKRSISPFVIGNSGETRVKPSQTATSDDTARLPQDLSLFIEQGTITQAILDNPIQILLDINSQLNITETSTFAVSTQLDSTPGGGTANIAFLVGASSQGPNANAVQMDSTFWIETIESEITVQSYTPGNGLFLQPAYKQGQGKMPPPLPTFAVTPPGPVVGPKTIPVTYTQIQYSQTVFLNFNGLSWPHISLATLLPSQPIKIELSTTKNSLSTDNYAFGETSRLHFLIPASEPTKNLCANIISVLANRYSIPTIIGYDGKDEYDAKAAHIAKLYSIQRYLHGPAGKYADDLVIVVDGHDVLAQLPVEVLIGRYFEIMKRHDQVLADRFGLTVAQAHEHGLRQSLLWGADKACFPRKPNEAQCWGVPKSFLAHDIHGPYTQDRSMRYTDPRYLNSGTVVGPLGDLRDCVDAALTLIKNTWNATFEYRNSDQYYLGKLYGRQEINRTKAITGGGIPNLKGTRQIPSFADFGTDRADYGITVDHESAFTCTQCENAEWMRNIAFDRPDHRSLIKSDNPQKKHPFKPFMIQMPGTVLAALTRLYEAIDLEQPARQWISGVKLGTNIATGHIYLLYHGTCKKSNFIDRYTDLWLYPVARRLLKTASKALEAKEPLSERTIDGRHWISSRYYPENGDRSYGLGGVYTDSQDGETFAPLTEFCESYLDELAPEMAA